MGELILPIYNIDIDGVILPSIRLSDDVLEAAVNKLNIPNFRGCYCIDMLPKICNKAESGILNLDKFTGDGTHWVAWYVNNNNKIYFDSYGVDPPLELVKYLAPALEAEPEVKLANPAPSIYCSTESIQPRGTPICGHLCLYVLKKLSDGMEYVDVINSLI
jgi:hypothetical protein